MGSPQPTTSLTVLLYRALCHAIREFDKSCMPLVGIVGRVPSLSTVDVQSQVRHAFRHPAPGVSVDDGFTALRQLAAQLSALKRSEEATQGSLARWHLLLQTHALQSHSLSPARLCQALEDGSMLLHQLVKETRETLDGDADMEVQAADEEQLDGGPPSTDFYEALDSLAQQVRKDHPQLWNSGGGSGSSSSGSGSSSGSSGGSTSGGRPDTLSQLEAISSTLFKRLRFKHKPVEWVYDGLAPLLLPDVLRRRKGVPLTLAILYNSVAHRLGLTTSLAKATNSRITTQPGPIMFADAPPEVLARQAGRTLATCPAPDIWLVTASAPASAADHPQVLLVDVDKRGRVMHPEQATQLYPDLVLPPPHGGPAHPASAPTLVPARTLVALFAESLRLAVVAHQRRGESDLVAHFLYQLLALDPTAPEWDLMLGRGELE